MADVVVQPFNPDPLDPGTPLPPQNPYLDTLKAAPLATGASPMAPANPYLSTLQSAEETRQQQMSATASRAITVNPDKYATQKRVANYLGYPPAAVEALPVQTEREAKLKEIQDNTANSGALQNRFTDEDFARLAHDDTGILSVLSNSFKRGWPGLKQVLPGMAFRADANALKNFEDIETKLASGQPVLDTEDPMALRYMTPQKRQQLKDQLLAGAGESASNIARLETEKRKFPSPEIVDRVAAEKTIGGIVSTFLTDPVKYIAAIGPESLVQNAPGLLAGGPMRKLGGTALGAATMGANSFVTDYNSSLLEGLSKAGIDITNGEALAAAAKDTKLMQQVAAQAFAHATIVGGVDTLSAGAASKIPLPGTTLATRPLAREAANMAVQTPAQGALGGLGELGGQIAAGQEINLANIFAEVVGEGFGAPAEVASMVGGHFKERAAQARAQADFEKTQQIFKDAAESKLRERSPETFQSLIQDLADETPNAPKEVRFDARTLVETLQQAGIDEVGLAQFLPSVLPQLEEALAVGGEITVPIGEFTSVVGTELEKTLLEQARIGDNEFSQAESKQADEQATQLLAEQAQRVIEQAGDSSAMQVSAESVKTTVLDQLNASKRFTPEVNEAYATLVRDFYTTTAGRIGITPDELYARYPLSVQGEGVGPLDQPAYHGTPHTVDKFTTQKIGTGEGAQAYGWGMYFAGNKEIAEFYRKNLAADARVREINTRLSELAKIMDADTAGEYGKYRSDVGRNARKEYDALMAERASDAPTKGGNTYKVEVPEDEDMLDYDATFKEQSPKVQAALEKAGISPTQVEVRLPNSKVRVFDTMDQARRAIKANNWDAKPVTVPNTMTGKEIYAHLESRKDLPGVEGSEAMKPDEAASKALLAAGIPGLRFLDAGSRGTQAKGKTHNYVIFDDQHVGAPEVLNQEGDPTQTEAFKKWFGDSKVVDVLGNPLVVYHGSPDARFLNEDGIFATLKERMLRFGATPESKRDATKSRAFFFTSSKRVAKTYADPKRAFDYQGAEEAVIPTYVSLQNPLEFDAGGKHWREAQKQISKDDFIARAKEEGHDGVIIKNVRDSYDSMATGRDPTSDVFVAFESKQIKHAESNSGAFDPNNPSILEQGPRGTFNPETLTISLLQKADLSTFLHETGHAFLTIMADIAAQPNAPAGMVSDMEAVLKWFGVKDLATWNAMTLEQQRKYHEKFAESFEQYLLDGKAPSAELQPLFQRFRSWLTNVYRSLTEFLARAGNNAQLSDEVRAVFDRLLASDEQIRQMEALRSYAPIFESAEQAGMTPEEWVNYQKQGEKGTATALDELAARSIKDMRWTTNARNKALKALQKDAATKRKAVEKEVAAEVAQEPVYQAQRWLRKGEMTTAEGEEVKAEKGFRLNTEALAEMYPESMLGRPELEGLKGMTASNGLHPDMVAEMFGYGSGDELVRAILDAEPMASVIEGKTDQRLLERFGDLATEQGIRRAADEAVHNEARGRFIATGLHALQKASAQTERTPAGGSVNVMVRAAKQFASQLVARRKVRDLKAGQHTAAEARAGRAAQEAMRKGKTDEAIVAQRDQLLNHYAARETYKALGEVDKALTYLKKFDKDGTRKKLPPEYLDQIDKLLERVDLRQTTNKALDKRAKLAEWVKTQQDMGIDVELPAGVLEDAQLESYRDMSVESLRGLVDTIKQIEHLGRLKNKLLTAKDQRERDEIFTEIADAILASRAKDAKTRAPTTVWDRKVASVLSFGAAHVKTSTWARIFDGGKDGGPAWTYMIRPANAASDNQTQMRAEATARIAEIEKPWFDRKDLNVKREVPGVFKRGDGRAPGAKGSSFTFQELLGIALNTGNEGNLQRLLGGEGWTPAQLDTLLAPLTTADWARIQKVWDTFEGYRPLIGEMEKRVFGKEPDWVEPMARNVTTADGKAVEVKGGYFPIRYDPAASARAEEHLEAEGAKRQLQGAYSAATVRRGFVKGRVEEVNGRPLIYSLETVHSALEDTIHYLSWQEWLIDMNRMLRSGSKIEAAMREKYGPEVVKQFKTWRDAVAEGEAGVQQALDGVLGKFRQYTSFAGLAYNVVSAATQVLGVTQSIVRVGPKAFGQGVTQYLAHPIDSAAQVRTKSKFMANRARTRWRDLNELTNAVRGQTKARRSMLINGYWLMGAMQGAVDMPTWMGAYQKAIVGGSEETDAVALADQAVSDSQGSGRLSDLAAIERGGPAQKLFTGFYTFMNTALNLGVVSGMTAKSRAKLVTDMLLLYTIPAVLGSALKDALTPGDAGDDDWEKIARKALGNQISYLLGLFVYAREFSDAAKWAMSGERPTDYKGPVGLRAIADAYQFVKQTGQWELDTAWRKAAINLAGDLFGIPSAQINRSINGAEALAEGKTKNPAALATGYQEAR